MNKVYLKMVSAVLAAVMIFSLSACGNTEKKLDLSALPLVYASESKGLMMIKDGETKSSLITENYHKTLSNSRVQAAANGKLYFIESENKNSFVGNLCEYDVNNGKKSVLHSNVYSFALNSDASCIMIMEGTGKLIKYDKKSEKKNSYKAVEASDTRSIVKVSEDGKYVLYTKNIATTANRLFISKTDYAPSETTEKWNNKQILANKDINTAPVALADGNNEFIGASSDLSVVYYLIRGNADSEKEDAEQQIIHMFSDYKTDIKVYDGEATPYFLDGKNQLFFSSSVTGSLKVTDIVTDSSASADAKLKKPSTKDEEATAKYEAKLKRDNMRQKIKNYLNNINVTEFYKIGKGMSEPEKLFTLSGQLTMKGIDAETGAVFYGATLYHFDKAEKTDINKVKIAYQLFDEIKSRDFICVGTGGVYTLQSGKEDSVYNSADCFVDTENKRVSVIMDFDYTTEKKGTLYTAKYSEKGFETPVKVSEEAVETAHFNVADGTNYFVNKDNALVKDNAKSVVLKNYYKKTANPECPVVLAGSEKENKAYVITNGKAVELGSFYALKDAVSKGDTFAFYTAYNSEKAICSVSFWNGSSAVKLGNDITEVISFVK